MLPVVIYAQIQAWQIHTHHRHDTVAATLAETNTKDAIRVDATDAPKSPATLRTLRQCNISFTYSLKVVIDLTKLVQLKEPQPCSAQPEPTLSHLPL